MILDFGDNKQKTVLILLGESEFHSCRVDLTFPLGNYHSNDNDMILYMQPHFLNCDLGFYSQCEWKCIIPDAVS